MRVERQGLILCDALIRKEGRDEDSTYWFHPV